MKSDQTTQEVISVIIKSPKKLLDVFKIVSSALRSHKITKSYKIQNNEYKFKKKIGEQNWSEFVKKVKNYQSIPNFANYDQKLCNKISKKYGLKFAVKYDESKDTYHVIIANGNLDKIEDFINEYHKEYGKKKEHNEKIKDFEIKSKNIKEIGEKDLDNDGVIDRLDPDKNRPEIKEVKDYDTIDRRLKFKEDVDIEIWYN